MRKGFEIIKPVLDRFPGLPEKLNNLFGKGKTWWYSHGYASRKDDPNQNGNLSPVDHALHFIEQYKAIDSDAGKMLAENVIAELLSRFHIECAEKSDREFRQNLNEEFFEAMRQFDIADLKDQSPIELGKTESEFTDIRRVIDEFIAVVRAEKRRKEVSLAESKEA